MKNLRTTLRTKYMNDANNVVYGQITDELRSKVSGQVWYSVHVPIDFQFNHKISMELDDEKS